MYVMIMKCVYIEEDLLQQNDIVNIINKRCCTNITLFANKIEHKQKKWAEEQHGIINYLIG